MVLAIPGRSVRSYWRPVGGHGRSLGGHGILVMGWGGGYIWDILETILGISGGYLGIYWRYIGDI